MSSPLSNLDLIQISALAHRASEEATAARWLLETDGNRITAENRLEALRRAVREQAERLGFDLVERKPAQPVQVAA